MADVHSHGAWSGFGEVHIGMFNTWRAPTAHISGGVWQTHVDLTVSPKEVVCALTLVLPDVMKAGSSIETWAGGAGVWPSDFAVLPSEAVGAHAVVGAVLLFAGAPVSTGRSGTGIEPDFLAVLAPVSVLALTAVASVALVAVASVQTRRRVAHRLGLYIGVVVLVI